MKKLGWMDYIRMLVKGRPALEAAIAEGNIVAKKYQTDGIKSAGFWIAALAGLATVIGQFAGVIPPPYGSLAATGSAFIYAIARGLVKRDDPLAGLKPMASTSEAWLNIAAALSSVLMATQGVVSPEAAAALASANAAVLSISQALAQSGAQPGKEDLPQK